MTLILHLMGALLAKNEDKVAASVEFGVVEYQRVDLCVVEDENKVDLELDECTGPCGRELSPVRLGSGLLST